MLDQLAVSIACVLIVLLRWSWRVSVCGREPPRASLVVFWHGDIPALLALPRRARRRLAVLVSRSRDGARAAILARRLGLGVVRGSSSRGAVAGGLALARRLRGRGSVALAVDGPRGPRRQIRADPCRLARLAGAAPVVPLGAWIGAGVSLGSWDGMVIPWPFSKVVLAWGSPVLSGDCAAELAATSALAARASRRGSSPEVST